MLLEAEAGVGEDEMVDGCSREVNRWICESTVVDFLAMVLTQHVEPFLRSDLPTHTFCILFWKIKKIDFTVCTCFTLRFLGTLFLKVRESF